MSAYAFREPISNAFARFRADAQGRETVSVFDVVVDRENRQYFDILFDKPLGQGKWQGGSSPQPTVQTRPYPKQSARSVRGARVR